MRSIRCLLRQQDEASVMYLVTDRLHRERIVRVRADEIVETVSGWLALLGVDSPLVQDLERTVCNGDWAAAHAIAEMLSIDVVAA